MTRWIFAIFGLLSFAVVASQEAIIPPYQVTIAADAGKPFGDVTMEITTEKKVDNPKIVAIRLKKRWRMERCPEEGIR